MIEEEDEDQRNVSYIRMHKQKHKLLIANLLQVVFALPAEDGAEQIELDFDISNLNDQEQETENKFRQLILKNNCNLNEVK